MTAVLPSGQTDEATLAQSRADQTRAAAVSLVQALYRLVKASHLHADTNAAVASLVRFTQEAVSDYCQKAQVEVVTLHFTKDTAFINGQMLRAARQAYQCSAELAAILDKGGVSEITIPAATADADISAFARAAVEASRDRANPGRLIDARCGGIQLRKVNLESVDSEAARQESPQERIVKTYASAVVVMREFNEQLRSGNVRLPHRLKRIAQRLISHAEEDVRTLVSLAGGKVVGGRRWEPRGQHGHHRNRDGTAAHARASAAHGAGHGRAAHGRGENPARGVLPAAWRGFRSTTHSQRGRARSDACEQRGDAHRSRADSPAVDHARRYCL